MAKPHWLAFTASADADTVVGPPAHAIVTNPDVDIDGVLWPLLSTVVNGQVLPVLYTEMYGRSPDGAPLAVRLKRDRALWRIEADSLRRIRDFHAELGLPPTRGPASWRRSYLAWHKLHLDPLTTAPGESRHERETAWFNTLGTLLNQYPTDAARLFQGACCFFRGPGPIWLQDDQTPVDSTGQPMRFIVQASAALLTDDAGDFVHYLFTSHSGDELAQVTQL
jgi:hypothetical protein